MSFTLWRGVVGMVRPTRRPGTLEELIRILPEGIGIVPLLLNFKAGSNAEFLNSIPQYERFASELAEQGVDVIMLTGAPPFMLLGPEKEAALTRQWTKKFKTPVITDPQMQVAALRAMKIKKFIGASYSALQNKIVLDYMTAAGFRALSMEPIDVPFDQVAQISVEMLYAHVKSLYRQAPRCGRRLYPGRWLADGAGYRAPGKGSWDTCRARDDLPSLADPQASRCTRNQARLRPSADRVAVAGSKGHEAACKYCVLPSFCRLVCCAVPAHAQSASLGADRHDARRRLRSLCASLGAAYRPLSAGSPDGHPEERPRCGRADPRQLHVQPRAGLTAANSRQCRTACHSRNYSRRCHRKAGTRCLTQPSSAGSAASRRPCS